MKLVLIVGLCPGMGVVGGSCCNGNSSSLEGSIS